MFQSYEYKVCTAQYGRVTFVDEKWQGRTALSSRGETDVLIESCPSISQFLREAGGDGWELVSVVSHPQAQPEAVQDVLYLKRPAY